MNHNRLYAVTTEFKTVRQLAAEALTRYRERKTEFPPLPLAQVHDISRPESERAPQLDVDRAVRGATYEIKGNSK